MGKLELANNGGKGDNEPSPPPYSSGQSVNDTPPYRQHDTPGSEVAVDECIVHLKLLSAIAILRNSIRGTDQLFGVHDSEAGYFSDPQKQAQAAARIREKRWAVYVARAVDRFTIWWQTCVPNGPAEAKLIWAPNMMPPLGQLFSILHELRFLTYHLDIIMVLHAYMLNPRAFFEDCLRQSKMNVWAAGLPWNIINEYTDNRTFLFNPGKEAKMNFETASGLYWDNLLENSTKPLPCFSCKQELLVPWTEPSIGCDPDVAFAHCVGYADKSLRFTCPTCKLSITHNLLSVQKFHGDLQKLLMDNLPMPGTLLTPNGRPVGDEHDDDMSFPNRLLKNDIRSKILQLSDVTQNEHITIDAIRDYLDDFLKSRPLTSRAKKVSLRNMLSRYWDNSSPFALNLIGAVIRQGTFVEKMDDIGLINSPNLETTVGHFIDKYGVFFQIMAKNKNHAVVPTLDVDLVWHTHQLSPARYYAFSTAQIDGIFVDHDDKIDEIKLSDAFTWTSEQYQKLTGGKIYSECICWYCEAVRASHNEGLKRLMSSSANNAKANAARLHDTTGNATYGQRGQGPHISSHNAISIQTQAFPKALSDKNSELESHWKKSQRRSHGRSGSKSGGSAHEDMLRGKSKAPYARDPEILREIYPCNPVCANVTPGAPGNCISGTQGAGMAHGACVSGTMVAQTKGKGKSFCAGLAGCGNTAI